MARERKDGRLQVLIEEVRSESFVEGYHATDAECLGLILAWHFNWGGLEILRTAYAALEDSNWHTENETIQALIDKAQGPGKNPKTGRGPR